jgi:hypothetical protein
MTLESAQTVKRTSFGFFVFFAIIYLLAWLLWENGFYPEFLLYAVNYLDLPLYLTGITLIVASTITALRLTGEAKSSTALAVWIFAFFALAGLVILDLFAAPLI